MPGIAAEVYKEIGVAEVTLAGGEVLPAGERGVLDATEWYTPGEDISIGLHQVWKFYHYPGMHETARACDLLINQDVWDKLAPDLQAIVRAAAMQAVWRSLLQFNRLDAEALRDFQEKHKVTLVKTPDDVFVGYLEAWDKIAAAEAAKDPFFKKVLTRCLFHKYTASPRGFSLGAPGSSVASGAGLEPGVPRGGH